MAGLRFGFLTTFYPPHNFGGDGIGIQRLARGLVRAGHQVTVGYNAEAFEALSSRPAPPAAAEPAGLEVVPIRSGLGMLSLLATQQTGQPAFFGAQITALLDSRQIDVTVIHNASLIGGPGSFRLGRGLTLYMAHEHWLVCPTHVLWRHQRERCDGRECVRCQLSYRRPPQLWRSTGTMERALPSIDAFIAMSEFSRQKHREFGFQPEMDVVPYFLPDPEPNSPQLGDDTTPHPRPYFLFVGRLEKIKGLDDVIPLFRDYPDADLLIAGDGEYADTLHNLGLGIARVKFLGRVPGDDLQRYYQHAVALIVPSVCFETFGIILIEAFQQGTPVIARRLGPFPEIVEAAQAGELFSDTAELLAAMNRLQRDPGYRDRLAAAAYRAYLTRWSESAVVPQFLDVVRRAAVRKGDHRVLDRLGSAGAEPSASPGVAPT